LIVNFVEKIREAAVSVAPVMAIVGLLHFTFAPLGPGQFPQFLVGGVLLILGLGIFLVGADIGMVPFGQQVGSALTHRRSLALMLCVAFVIGFAITVAEPDVQVLAAQVSTIIPSLDKGMLLLTIAAGVGLFLLVGIGRIVFQIPLRLLLAGFYLLLFAACSLVDAGFVGVAFDAGGATTGPVTVPFIMALGVGVAAVGRSRDGSRDNSFGLVGLASIGPVAAVVCFGMADKGGMAQVAAEALPDIAPSVADAFLSVLPHVVQEIFLALLPLLLIFFVFQVLLLKLPARRARRMVFGLGYCFVGLTLFMTGVAGGFSPAGRSLGAALGAFSGGAALIPIGCLLGAVVVCAEPAVWILNQQIEELSGGYIKRKIMLFALSASIAGAVVLGMLRVVTGMSIWFVLLPGYALALLLTRFCPPLFTAIAFDSGGVASGPMATTFVLSVTLGASAALGGNPATDAFGMIAMIAMAPLVTVQFLGLIFKQLEKRRREQEEQRTQEVAG
jgi:hypothetical protein